GFKEIFSQFFPLGDATHYAHYVFNTFTRNHLGQISFEDFLASLSTVSRGTTQEKLQWIFGLYDVNNDGLITKAEMVDVVSAIYEMMGRSTEPQVEESSAKEHVEKIFHLIDANQDGAITIEELAQWVSRDDTIIQSLSMMDTVLYTRRDAASSPPTHPTSPPTHPASPPTHPASPPTHPASPPTHPASPPTHPASSPTHPASPPTHPASPPTHPASPPTRPSQNTRNLCECTMPSNCKSTATPSGDHSGACNEGVMIPASCAQ
ncbi:Kv channel-interacting protein 4-like, partial [Penaeus indicus]|uniref:Kv channel-interacting protein 4-like n=1 Tax=Penaeus indicus TaxID=29960 RepID=UPI00300C1C87